MPLCCLWRNVEDSCHTLRRRLPSKTNSAAHQRLVSSTRWSVAAKYALTARHGAMQLLAQNRDFSLPHLHSTPPLGGFPSEYCHPSWYWKTRMTWLPDGEKIEDMFICFDTIHERDRHTDTHTHIYTAWRHRPRLCIASRGKNCRPVSV